MKPKKEHTYNTVSGFGQSFTAFIFSSAIWTPFASIKCPKKVTELRKINTYAISSKTCTVINESKLSTHGSDETLYLCYELEYHLYTP